MLFCKINFTNKNNSIETFYWLIYKYLHLFVIQIKNIWLQNKLKDLNYYIILVCNFFD